MTLAEAIDWISKQNNCNRRAATVWIRAALADDAVFPLRWEDAVMDYPPVDRQFWLVEARIRRGRVFDPSAQRWRTLLIGKYSIFQIWPPDLASVATAASESGQATENGSDVVPITKSTGGRPSAEEEIYQALGQLSQKGHRVKDMDPMKLAKLVASKCGKQLGESKWGRTTVLRHIRHWRAIGQVLDRLSQEGHRAKDMDPMKLAELVVSKCGKQLGESKWGRTTVLRRIRHWRAEH
jgi:hypothetical protein